MRPISVNKQELLSRADLFGHIRRTDDAGRSQPEAMMFLGAYMPVGTWRLTTRATFYLENVRSAPATRREMPGDDRFRLNCSGISCCPVRVNNENL
ncbi:MAG: hypothetical protein ACLU9X_10390 [Alistipes shahii]